MFIFFYCCSHWLRTFDAISWCNGVLSKAQQRTNDIPESGRKMWANTTGHNTMLFGFDAELRGKKRDTVQIFGNNGHENGVRRIEVETRTTATRLGGGRVVRCSYLNIVKISIVHSLCVMCMCPRRVGRIDSPQELFYITHKKMLAWCSFAYNNRPNSYAV